MGEGSVEHAPGHHPVERQDELRRFARLVSDARSGAGSLTAIVGEPGIGKTRLLAELCSLAGHGGMTVLRARGQVLEVANPFGVVRRLFASPPPDELATTVALSLSAIGTTPSTGERDLFGVLEALFARLVARVASGPLLLAIDDVHWADEETLRFLGYVAARVERLPVMIVLACRPPDPASVLGALVDEAVTLRPPPLTLDGTGSLLTELTGAHPEAEFLRAFRHVTQGNPFLIEELALHLVEEGLALVDENAGEVTARVPDTVARAVQARLRRLPPPAAAVAEALAVLGGASELRLVADLAGLDREETAEGAELLRAGALLAADHPLDYRHPLVRAAIYEGMTPSARDQLHRRAARALAGAEVTDPDEAAVHLLAVEPANDSWAGDVLAVAGIRALAGGAPDSAVPLLRRALAEPVVGDQRAAVLVALGEAEMRRGRPAETIAVLSEVLATIDDKLRRGEVAASLGGALATTGQAVAGAEVLIEAIGDLPREAREVGLRLEAKLTVLADIDEAAGSLIRARRPRFRAGRNAPRSHGERLALAAHADHEMNAGSAAEGAALALVALDGGRLLAEEGPGSISFFQTALVLLYCDALDAAETVYTDAMQDAVERGSPVAASVAQGFRAGVAYRRGRLRDAAADGRAGLAVRHGLQLGGMFAMGFLADALTDLGRTADAAKLFEESGAERRLPDAVASILLIHARGRLRLAQGQPERALDDFLECGSRSDRWGIRTPAVASWQASAAIVCDALDRRSEADDLAAEAVTSARSFGSPRALGIALGAAGRVGRDLAKLEEAVAVLEGSGAVLEHARALLALGQLLRRTRQPALAHEQLQAGLRLARLCGALPLASAAYEELAAEGGEPRRIVRSGVESLTRREARVALLAGRGAANKEIAATLSVSVRTVEAHLARVYQKLDVHSRAELAAFAETLTQPP